MRIICVRTGDKFDQWYEDNLKYMIDKYSCLEYDEFAVIRDEEYEGVFNKLQMFDRYRDGQNLYFDLDVIIRGDCNNFLKKDFHVCHAWWRKEWHTPLNSSIMSWEGDRSDIFKLFEEDPEFYQFKYNKGMDQFIHENIDYKMYSWNDDYCSYQTVMHEDRYKVYLFNQNYQKMKSPAWYHKFLLPL